MLHTWPSVGITRSISIARWQTPNGRRAIALRDPSTIVACWAPNILHDSVSYSSSSSSSSISSKRWQARRLRDRFAIGAKVQGLKSRAAFKLLEVDCIYKRTHHYTKSRTRFMKNLEYSVVDKQWSTLWAIARNRNNKRTEAFRDTRLALGPRYCKLSVIDRKIFSHN